MCMDPATAAAASGTTGLIQTGLRFIGAIRSTSARKKSLRYQANVARQNQQLAEWKAADAVDRGKKAESRHRIRGAQFKASQEARLAANGFVVGEGDEAFILADTAEGVELDARTIRSNAAREAFAHKVAANNAFAQVGQFEKARGNVSYLPAFGQLVGGVAQVADKWHSYKSTTPTRSSGQPVPSFT